MKKQIVIIGIVSLLIFVGFSGCLGNDSDNELNKFVGTWLHGTLQTGGTIIFSSDGNCNYKNDLGIWEIKGGKLVINLTERNIILTFNYVFRENNKILELTNLEDGHVDDYKKQ